MAERIEAFRADDGTLHNDECSAVKRDLDMLIQGSPLAENAPYAKIATEWLAANALAIGKVLMHYADACPIIETVGKAPMDSGEGPIAHQDPHAAYCQMHNGFDCDCGANNGD